MSGRISECVCNRTVVIIVTYIVLCEEMSFSKSVHPIAAPIAPSRCSSWVDSFAESVINKSRDRKALVASLTLSLTNARQNVQTGKLTRVFLSAQRHLL